MQYFFYILRCADNSLYSGVTTDLNRRLSEHNGDGNKGAKYTRSHRPVQLVHTEQYEGRSAALRRESEVKNMTKEEKEKLLK
ncbi:endonuclease [Candidatus Roizmanbacteria bacterium CG_4_10_14_0_2_um_filter_39_13]|uniref:Endonuclease n=1 Tax=Candidatus Roizmanbacteria bacterium CG_4_10_14_0_2_um_filter_39_13 TaxID=1974825 RepID=A0A2M7TW94_9BACT|nr:MAG: endonuclease [Candidatus Roizmanbacteria bacterium CG_4_10_14_0_2_um_filter_39_13]